MPRLEQNNRTTIFDILFKKAIVNDVYPDSDTLDIEIVDHNEQRTGDIYSSVPIFYHCQPDMEIRPNGALVGSSDAFETNHYVIVKFEDNSPVVVRNTKGLVPCGYIFAVQCTHPEMEDTQWKIFTYDSQTGDIVFNEKLTEEYTPTLPDTSMAGFDTVYATESDDDSHAPDLCGCSQSYSQEVCLNYMISSVESLTYDLAGLSFTPDNQMNLTSDHTETYNCINLTELWFDECPGPDCDCGCGENVNCLWFDNQKRVISHSGTIYYLLQRAIGLYRPDTSTEIPVRGAIFVESDVNFDGETIYNAGTECVPYDEQCCTAQISWTHRFVLKIWIGDILTVDYTIGQALGSGEVTDYLLTYKENLSGSTFYGSTYFHINEKAGVLTIALPKTIVSAETTTDISWFVNGQRFPHYPKRSDFVEELESLTSVPTYNFSYPNYDYGYYLCYDQGVNTEVTPGKNAADGWFVFIYDINLDMVSNVSGIVDIMGMFTNEGVTPYWKYEVSFVKAGLIRKDQLIKV